MQAAQINLEIIKFKNMQYEREREKSLSTFLISWFVSKYV